MMEVFTGQTHICHPAEYQTGNHCCITCPPGSRVLRHCFQYRTSACLPCSDGRFMNTRTGLTQCYPCTNCDAGSGLKVKTSCTTTSDTVCEPLEGFFCIDSTENNCAAAQKHSSCQPGQYINKTGWYVCGKTFDVNQETFS
ncbi:tumor necrosis factor receptor superfamily member 14-like [Stegastes partitus]|uniref:Tumor necrosis factor receptor superfamily member 14-like n=1 Tax=Stegastes partitus TaxID=144197 RepID=A0A9Y4NFH4_9TELE|nr:PREDICTED: tumor necrosis factor receptor superfamily member 14-like [Stegastes partitus]